ncbi:MAG: acyl-CoA thioesterase [Paludibacteraceae bacterium]|nr:acyl-CoA thioesterase [Paludibacteraceae bacterium]
MQLSTVINVRVRFSEVDSIRMVWHGSYVAYLEDAREAFGREHGLEYLYMFHQGYLAPMYDLHLQYQQTAGIDDLLTVRITYHPCRGSKLMFDYLVTRQSDQAVILKATSIQLFTDLNGELQLSEPDFFAQWKRQHVNG